MNNSERSTTLAGVDNGYVNLDSTLGAPGLVCTVNETVQFVSLTLIYLNCALSVKVNECKKGKLYVDFVS